MPTTDEVLQEKFRTLMAERQAIEARSKSYRSRRESIAKQQWALAEQIKPLTNEIQAIEAPLINKSKEITKIVKALGGKTGPVKIEEAKR